VVQFNIKSRQFGSVHTNYFLVVGFYEAVLKTKWI